MAANKIYATVEHVIGRETVVEDKLKHVLDAVVSYDWTGELLGKDEQIASTLQNIIKDIGKK